MREQTNGMNLVRTGATRFATAFLILQCLHKLRPALRKLFGSEHWLVSKLAKTKNGKRVYEIVFLIVFWNGLEDWLNTSQPFLQVLRIAEMMMKGLFSQRLQLLGIMQASNLQRHLLVQNRNFRTKY